VFFVGRDGTMRSNRVLCQLAGQYGIDMFIGSSLQIDGDANSSTVTDGRLAGFGGAPNMGHDPGGRRHATATWMGLAHGDGAGMRGRKLVVQLVQTFRRGGQPVFVESLDALAVAGRVGLDLPPVMIYGDDVTHVVTEEGVAYLYKSESLEERREALAAVAGATPVGLARDERQTDRLRHDGLVALPEDLGVDPLLANRQLLAARSIGDLVAWSGGLYDPPGRFREW
jgi:malonate decarboxylase alpha subunit